MQPHETSPQEFRDSPPQVSLLDWKVLLGNTDQTLTKVIPDQPFDVRLTLDLRNTTLPVGSTLESTGTLYAKKATGGQRQRICETYGAVPYDRLIKLTIGNASLPAGYYRLEVLVSLKLVGIEARLHPGLMAFLEIGFLQVH